MAFRATNILPEAALREAKKTAVQVRNFCESRSARIGAVGANSFEIFNAVEALVEYKRRLNEVRSTPGLAQYARDQENDQTYNAAAEFTALLAAIDSAINNVVTTFPTDASGYLLSAQINADGSLNHRSFSPASLAGLKAELDAIVATIS